MTYQTIGNGPPAPPPQPPPRKSGVGLPLLIGGIGLGIGLVIGCIGGIAIGGANTDPKTNQAAATTNAPAAVQTTKTTVELPATTAPAKPAGPATTIGDGTWTVGVDIAAGTWRPTVAADSTCYWSVLKSGTNGRDIISNNIGGGRPTVTLKEGQDFETTRCGTWAKQ